MYASRAMAMLRLWRVIHVGRPVHVERDEETSPRTEPEPSPSPDPDAGRLGPLATAP